MENIKRFVRAFVLGFLWAFVILTAIAFLILLTYQVISVTQPRYHAGKYQSHAPTMIHLQERASQDAILVQALHGARVSFCAKTLRHISTRCWSPLD